MTFLIAFIFAFCGSVLGNHFPLFNSMINFLFGAIATTIVIARIELNK